MLTSADFDAPARLQYWPIVPDLAESARWEDARRFPSLREAIRVAMTEDRPDGKAAYLLTASGIALKPQALPDLWTSLQASGAPAR